MAMLNNQRVLTIMMILDGVMYVSIMIAYMLISSKQLFVWYLQWYLDGVINLYKPTYNLGTIL